MSARFWFVKQEPEAYSWSDLVADGRTSWSGVRNFQARNNLAAMQKGDLILFYHSGKAKEIAGVARVCSEPYGDPTAKTGEDHWIAVDIEAVQPLDKPVGLNLLKRDTLLMRIPLVRQSRLSVGSLGEAEFRRILQLAGTVL